NLRLDEAGEQFQKALELNPRDEYANLNLANPARAYGQDEEAVKYYRRQLALKPDDADARGGLAIALLALGRDEEAEPEIKRAMEAAPGNYQFLTRLAMFYTTRRKAALARPLIEQAARIEPRYAWTYIVKANIDALEGKHADALAAMISAQQLANFATLDFELAKALMALDGYDQALEVLNRRFKHNEDGEFETTLGGVVKARSPRLDLLIETERKAALFLNDHPTTQFQYRLAEALGRVDYYLKVAVDARKPAPQPKKRGRGGKAAASAAANQEKEDDLRTATRPRRARGEESPKSFELSAGRDADLPGVPQLLRAITTFATLDDGRQVFRMVWVARKLTDSGIALDAAEQLCQMAISQAEQATEPEGSMRDAPLLDRAGRRAVFLGRAHDALGWTLLKKGDIRGAIDHLTKSVNFYPPSREREAARWHLAVAMQEAGDDENALNLYIASYDPQAPAAQARRSQIEALYKKVHGTLNGLEQKLKRP
ncbi:MAG TPA: tetratricopeptide repeat protein, partial [Blastocatellia bacterium]|nr:tetratricopeptide repeat protein [Blastocatellia bacterium]